MSSVPVLRVGGSERHTQCTLMNEDRARIGRFAAENNNALKMTLLRLEYYSKIVYYHVLVPMYMYAYMDDDTGSALRQI